MIEKELKIRDFCGDYALDIPFADGSKPNHATVCEMEEIRHGKWEYDSGDVGYANYLCSECKNFLTFYEDIDLYPYCPYCGAKMDKKEENNA